MHTSIALYLYWYCYIHYAFVCILITCALVCCLHLTTTIGCTKNKRWNITWFWGRQDVATHENTVRTEIHVVITITPIHSVSCTCVLYQDTENMNAVLAILVITAWKFYLLICIMMWSPEIIIILIKIKQEFKQTESTH